MLMITSACVICWVAFVSSTVWDEHSLYHVADAIVHGQTFRASSLDALGTVIQQVQFSSGASPDSVRDLALIRLHEAERSFSSGDTKQTESSSVVAALAIRRSLSLSPCDPFLWFALSWTTLIRHGDPMLAAEFLRLSYETGPREGWVSLRRNSVALTLFTFLDDNLQNAAIAEFQEMANVAPFIPVVARLIAGPGRRFQEQLLLALSLAPDDNKKELARLLPELDVDTPVPGAVPNMKPFVFNMP